MGFELLRITSFESPITWIDVARRLARIEPEDTLWQSRPTSLLEATVDWAGVTFAVQDVRQTQAELLSWLRDVFPDRIKHGAFPDRINHESRSSILLDGPAPSDRLPIEIVEGIQEIPPFGSLGSIEGRIDFRTRRQADVKPRRVQVIACHSVKGGTGRTTVAVAMANSWAEKAGKPILIVDADLEAPGLSYVFRATRPEIDVGLEDLITLVHGDTSEDGTSTIEWVGRRLRGQKLGRLFVLPLRRSLEELASSGIRAEHIATADRPFAFADMLSQLACQCGSAGVVVDVRAGLVPLAAQLVLDPQVARVVVTSVAGQSLEATVTLMDFVSRELRKQGQRGIQPLLVVNRIPGFLRDLGQDEAIIGPFIARIEQSILPAQDGEIPPDRVLFDSAQALAPLAVVKLGEVADLQVPSRRWDGFFRQLESSGFVRSLNAGLLPWLDQFVPADDGPQQGEVRLASSLEQRGISGPAEGRLRLAEFTRRFIAAETSDEPVENPLITGPMRALVSDIAQLPVVICEGAKGTGKTLTARYLLSKSSWTKAAVSIGGITPVVDAEFLPVLGSVQASSKFQSEIDAARSAVAQGNQFGTAQPIQALRMLLREKASERATEREWSDLWLDAIAWSAGYRPGDFGAGSLLLTELSQKTKKFVVLIEGVEELYDNPSDPALAPMLRALLLDLPLRLRGAPGRPLGLILFARRDTVDAGVAQNRSQFRQQYQDYALTWNEDSVLELAAWLATESGALQIWDNEFYRLSTEERERRLALLWGTKLGPDDQPGGPRVQEAYTAGWVIAALSDLQERLVARDLVRFLHNAAGDPNQAESRERYGARLLFPKALRDAMGPTSRSKVEETEEEIPDLKQAFQKFRENANLVKAPLDQDSIASLGLTLDDLESLKFHGIVLGDAPPYEVPELFRMGLGLRHAGARYSVIGTRRRARQRLAKGI